MNHVPLPHAKWPPPQYIICSAASEIYYFWNKLKFCDVQSRSANKHCNTACVQSRSANKHCNTACMQSRSANKHCNTAYMQSCSANSHGLPVNLPLADGLNGWWQFRVGDETQNLCILMSRIRRQSGWFHSILIQKHMWLRYVMPGWFMGEGGVHWYLYVVRFNVKILCKKLSVSKWPSPNALLTTGLGVHTTDLGVLKVMDILRWNSLMFYTQSIQSFLTVCWFFFQGYNDMKTELSDYLKKFVDNGKVVREEDIREFFETMEARKKQRTATTAMQWTCKWNVPWEKWNITQHSVVGGSFLCGSWSRWFFYSRRKPQGSSHQILYWEKTENGDMRGHFGPLFKLTRSCSMCRKDYTLAEKQKKNRCMALLSTSWIWPPSQRFTCAWSHVHYVWLPIVHNRQI